MVYAWHLLRLVNQDIKKYIMKNKKEKLAGKDIYIESDLTTNEKFIMGKLKVFANYQKSLNKKVKIAHLKVIVNDIVYVWDENKQDVKEVKATQGTGSNTKVDEMDVASQDEEEKN